jgi:hypothetical protein
MLIHPPTGFDTMIGVGPAMPTHVSDLKSGLCSVNPEQHRAIIAIARER